MIRPPILLIWLLRLFLYALLLCGCYQEARADCLWQLHLGSYPSDTSHGIPKDNAVDWWDLETYATADECWKAADVKLKGFHGSILPDGSRTLPVAWCSEVKA